MKNEFEVLIQHIGHDVWIDLPGYDAAVNLICGTCSDTLLSYSDPKGFRENV